MKQEAVELAITSVFEDQVRKFVETEDEAIFKNLNYSENLIHRQIQILKRCIFFTQLFGSTSLPPSYLR